MHRNIDYKTPVPHSRAQGSLFLTPCTEVSLSRNVGHELVEHRADFPLMGGTIVGQHGEDNDLVLDLLWNF